MKSIITKIFVLLLLGMAAASCSFVNKDITEPEAVSVHAEGAQAPASPNFHGKLAVGDSLQSCQKCHAADFSGGTAKLSCATAECHPTISVHQTGILAPTSAKFHGKFLLATGNDIISCTQCHGEDFKGGSVDASCANQFCHPSIPVHKSGILNQNSSNFHGTYIVNSENDMFACLSCHGEDFAGGDVGVSCNNSDCHPTITVHKDGVLDPTSDNYHALYFGETEYDMYNCQNCHGTDFAGGDTGLSCTTCHSGITVHNTGITDPASDNFHGKYMNLTANYDLTLCITCHGDDYTGMNTAISCETSGCHEQANGPEACNTCHGDFNNPSQISPPNDLAGNSETSFKGVGAHEIHLNGVTIAQNLECSQCHTVPSSVTADGHIDANDGAELNFGDLANSGPTAAEYLNEDLKCNNTYCHGNFAFGDVQGNNFNPQWNVVDGTQAACGTCHGQEIDGELSPLPVGHFPITGMTCSTCHLTVVDADNNIIDKTKHINGEADF
ncbi:MAG: hypothetical protein K9J16_01140 [Melioribacteraceae bacterium]|nr:hypothetical protein [Melioribacteraceae bacterium]MCF8356166.1 hypothetical protein [Melioribacteraceae bacterium]MCF8392332.1 hypothetical protein [Melioribacteraceae bacterium]MCF8417664.1 hypothetical protein [Melioribacteraceae bacterium]